MPLTSPFMETIDISITTVFSSVIILKSYMDKVPIKEFCPSS